MKDADSKTRLSRPPDPGYAAAVVREALGTDLMSRIDALDPREIEIVLRAIGLLKLAMRQYVERANCEHDPGSERWEQLLGARFGEAVGVVHRGLPPGVTASLSIADLVNWYYADSWVDILRPENADRFVRAGHLEDIVKAKSERTRWLRNNDADPGQTHLDLYGDVFTSFRNAARAIGSGTVPDTGDVEHLARPRSLTENGQRSIADQVRALDRDEAIARIRRSERRCPALVGLEDFARLGARRLVPRVEVDLRSDPAGLCEFWHIVYGIKRERVLKRYNPTHHVKVTVDQMRYAAPAVKAAVLRALRAS